MQTCKVNIQDIILDSEIVDDSTMDMYYRSTDRLIRGEEGGLFISKNTFLDFSTYFNTLSLKKWMKYTKAKVYGLELTFCGHIKVELFGHYINSRNVIQKEWLGRYQFDAEEKETIDIKIPSNSTSAMVVAFQITALKKSKIYSGNYYAVVNENDVVKPNICLVTTTFKKEEYLMRNVSILNKTLFDEENKSKYNYKWVIVDNACTINPEEINNDCITVVPNKNVGGAGGFTKGMLTAINNKEKFTHVLLMDDDVFFLPEAFKRLHSMLSILKPEYKDYFVSGAMLECSERNIQHEDIGYMSEKGEHGPIKPRYDLNKWENVVLNEIIVDSAEKLYAGWWFCCIPTTIAREDNLPLPFFIRGDDVEYSLRNNAKFITLNGICIWHEGFATKFSGALELYQVHRNDLILTAIHEELAELQVMQRIAWLFWEEVYKFNYKGANLLIDAIEDYLKGPDYLSNLNGEECMKEKKLEDNELVPLSQDLLMSINDLDIYSWKSLNKFIKFFYDYTCNGQKRINLTIRGKKGYIPYGWGYCQKKIAFCDKVYAVDLVNNLYAVFSKDRKAYKKVTKRYSDVMEKYRSTHLMIDEKWKEAEAHFISNEFWEKYLSK